MIIRKLLYVSIVLFFSLESLAQSECRDTIVIKAVNVNIKTFSSVRCSTFEKELGSKIKLKEICCGDTITAFKSLISKAKRSNQKIDTDVRIKIYLRLQNHKAPSILCMDKFGNITLNDHLIRKNKKLIKLIKDCLPEDIL